MEWTESLKRAIHYTEEHLLDDINASDVADAVFLSPFYFQKGFKIMTGCSIGEYIRCRRLYMAALDVIKDNAKIIDLAYKYGYDTPESFSKAFSRFHGSSPLQLRVNPGKIKTFLPLTVTINIKGGHEMDYTIEKMDTMKVIGLSRKFSYETSYKDIPLFWDDFRRTFCDSRSVADNDMRMTVESCTIGEFAICIEDPSGQEDFRYMIAGKYDGQPVPKGMEIYELPSLTWAKFRCTGPMPGALQAVNTKIYKEWLPGNPEFEMAAGANIEWYDAGDCSQPDYKSEVWIPVKRK